MNVSSQLNPTTPAGNFYFSSIFLVKGPFFSYFFREIWGKVVLYGPPFFLLFFRKDGEGPSNSTQWSVVFTPHPGQMLPGYARVGSAGTERMVHHHTAVRENQRQSLQRANARGALGIWVSLPLLPHTHGLGGHTHGLGGWACRDRDARWTVTGGTMPGWRRPPESSSTRLAPTSTSWMSMEGKV